MMNNNLNYNIDPQTRAVLFKKSPELQELIKLHKKVDTLESKLEEIIKVLKEAQHHE